MLTSSKNLTRSSHSSPDMRKRTETLEDKRTYDVGGVLLPLCLEIPSLLVVLPHMRFFVNLDYYSLMMLPMAAMREGTTRGMIMPFSMFRNGQ